jgi:hypothetical protein
VQVPSTWRSIIEEPSTLQLFLDFYAASKPPLSSMALECLVSCTLTPSWWCCLHCLIRLPLGQMTSRGRMCCSPWPWIARRKYRIVSLAMLSALPHQARFLVS